MCNDLERILKERKMEEDLMLNYLITDIDEKGRYVHSLKKDTPQEIQDFFKKWLKEVTKNRS